MDPVLCRVCGAAFKNRSSLRQHELWQANESPYACCDKLFIQREHTSGIDANSMGRRVLTPVKQPVERADSFLSISHTH